MRPARTARSSSACRSATRYGNGITLNASSITLNNNYVGVGLNGAQLANSGDGVYVAATSSGNNIGYNPDALGVVSNVISGNGGNGISLHGSLTNTIVSNRIGTSVDGTTAMGNGGNGIWVTDRSNGNTIGGDAIGVNAEGQPNDPTNDKGDGGRTAPRSSSRRRSATWCRATARTAS